MPTNEDITTVKIATYSERTPLEGTLLEGATLRGMYRRTDSALRDDEVWIDTDRGAFYFYHEPDCCRLVKIESITGWCDALVGAVVRVAEERTTKQDTDGGSQAATSYTIQTDRGDIDMRWIGKSSGLSETVCVDMIAVPDDASPMV